MQLSLLFIKLYWGDMKLNKLCSLFYKQAHHSIQRINENNLIGYDYDKDFINDVMDKYNDPIISKMVQYGDLRLGLLLKRLEGEGGLFDEWLEQFSKTYSPLMYPEFEDDVEQMYKGIYDRMANRIKKLN